ncbi:MAG: hypothetical protein KJ792_12000 [Actinobacteria bacterium]|nr:hypothetical protein [Actinomycetota bacterium]MCG2801105.1 hypothetical protein [Cellulomonas sp.]
MTNQSEARALARRLADAASVEDAAAWATGSASLELLDGRSWLAVDHAARESNQVDGAPVSGVRRWLGPTASEPSGFVAAVTSLHVDGRFRERAVRLLATAPRAIAVPALAVRLLDHVPQVRALAREVLRPLADVETAEAVLDVLLAGADGQHARHALDVVQVALVDAVPADVLVDRLMDSGRPRVRRWALVLGHDRDLLTPERLVAAAQSDPDQWIRSVCAEWVTRGHDPGPVVALLAARSVEARLVALARVRQIDLADGTLAGLLVDHAPRVRDLARRRAGERHLDLAAFYRGRLVEEDSSARVVAACLEWLALMGDEADLDAAIGRLRHPSARVRAAAVVAVGARATRGRALDLLTPMMLDPSSRVGASAARGLARLGAPPSTAQTAWASGQVSSRRSAWRLARACGGWHRVEADLRAAGDPAPRLAAEGQAGIRTWLQVDAATTWQELTVAQRSRIAALIPGAGLGRDQRRALAFHAGITVPDEVQGPGLVASTPGALRPRWLRGLRRR